MDKKVRKAVRSFLIENNSIVAIKYKGNENKDYYDIPGGKIEENESSPAASIREFKEETGIDIISQIYKGNVIVEYPERIFDFDIYIVKQYAGKPLEFAENYSMWIDIKELLSKNNIFPSVEIIKHLKEENINLKIYEDENHKIIKTENL